jgi:flagellar hook-associated protein 2
MFNIDGIASGFDTTTIIESLLGFQQQQIETFDSRKAEVTTEQTSFKGIEAQLLTLQSSLSRVNRNVNSVFDARTATSSNEDVVTATAGGRAIAASYQLTVEQLATAHQVASQGFSGTDLVATGDVTFRVGDRDAKTITIDSSNNTLEGFVNAINDQVEDINASIVFDQATDSHRILLSSRHTGAENTISITSSQDPLTGVLPDFSGPAVQPPLNAVVRLGSGAGAILAEYESNTIDGLIDNVTLELNKAEPGTPVQVNVEADIESAQEAVEGFVQDFNAIIEFIDEQTRFNPETGEASPLLGNRSAASIRNELLTLVTSTVSGSSIGRLSEIGIDLNLQGRLSVDSGKLERALRGELEGVDAGEIRTLFGLNATSSNSGIRFLGGSIRTQASDIPYQVDITQAAERAVVTGGSGVAASTVIDASNNALTITVNGVASDDLILPDGTYTAEELASQVESVINNSSTLGIHDVSVSVDSSNRLVIRTEAYGSAAGITSLGGSALSALGLDGTESDTGQDVAGTFVVNGTTESARGSGRILTGLADNENTADLRLEVTLTADQVTAGNEADLNVTQGITGRVSDYIGRVLDTERGLLKTVNDAFEQRIASIDRSIEQVREITEAKRQNLIEEFAALESVINELQTTGNFITSQLTSLGSFGGGNQRSNNN